MIRLLLLFVLAPAIVFSQTLRKDVVDSIKAATVNSLYNVSALLGNNAGTRAEHVAVFDTGEYVTVVVRIHVVKKDTITALYPAAPVNMKTADIVAVSMGTVAVSSLPPPVAEPLMLPDLPLLPLVNMKTGDMVVVNMGKVTVPPLPPTVAEAVTMDALPLLPPMNMKTGDIAAVSVSPVAVPPLPAPVAEMVTIDALPLLPPVNMKTGNVVAVIGSPVSVPPLPPLVAEADKIDALALLPLVSMKTGAIVAVSVGTVAVPPLAIEYFQEKEMPVAEMHLSPDGYNLLEKLEGFSPELYSLKDGGFTIGFGFFVPYAETNKWDNGITLEEADRMMRQKVPAYEDQVKQYINVPLTQNEFDALTMLAYNLGGFSKATSIVNDINSQAGFDKLQGDWNRFVHSKAPGVAKGLMNRRKDELGVKAYAEYQPERKIQILKIRK